MSDVKTDFRFVFSVVDLCHVVSLVLKFEDLVLKLEIGGGARAIVWRAVRGRLWSPLTLVFSSSG